MKNTTTMAVSWTQVSESISRRSLEKAELIRGPGFLKKSAVPAPSLVDPRLTARNLAAIQDTNREGTPLIPRTIVSGTVSDSSSMSSSSLSSSSTSSFSCSVNVFFAHPLDWFVLGQRVYYVIDIKILSFRCIRPPYSHCRRVSSICAHSSVYSQGIIKCELFINRSRVVLNCDRGAH